MDAERSTELVDRQAVDEVEAQDRALACAQRLERGGERGPHRGARICRDQLGLGIEVERELLEQRLRIAIDAAIVAHGVEAEPHRGQPDQCAEIAATDEGADPRHLPWRSDEQALAQPLQEILDRSPVAPHAAQRLARGGEVAVLEPPDRGGIAGRARARQRDVIRGQGGGHLGDSRRASHALGDTTRQRGVGQRQLGPCRAPAPRELVQRNGKRCAVVVGDGLAERGLEGLQ